MCTYIHNPIGSPLDSAIRNPYICISLSLSPSLSILSVHIQINIMASPHHPLKKADVAFPCPFLENVEVTFLFLFLEHVEVACPLPSLKNVVIYIKRERQRETCTQKGNPIGNPLDTSLPHPRSLSLSFSFSLFLSLCTSLSLSRFLYFSLYI